MSINFDSGGGPAQWQESDTTNLATGMKSRPCSFGGWIRITESVLSTHQLMSIQNSAAADNYFFMQVDGNGKLETIVDDAGTARSVVEVDDALVINTWHHVIMVVTTFDHRGYLDGVSNYNQGILPTPSSLDEVSAGSLDGGTANTFHGDLSRWGFWSSAHSQADINLLAGNRYAPPLVSPGTLEHYFKWGTKDDVDTKDGLTWSTVTGSPTTTSDVPGIVDNLPGITSGMMPQAFRRTVTVNAY